MLHSMPAVTVTLDGPEPRNRRRSREAGDRRDARSFVRRSLGGYQRRNETPPNDGSSV